jgi:hypothetical protein
MTPWPVPSMVGFFPINKKSTVYQMGKIQISNIMVKFCNKSKFPGKFTFMGKNINEN